MFFIRNKFAFLIHFNVTKKVAQKATLTYLCQVLKIHLIKKRTIYEYIDRKPEAASGFRNWLRILNTSIWHEPADILKSFVYADILGKGTNRVIFNIGGNKFRCICTYSFGDKFVHLFINWVGTHAEYDKLCKQNLQYTISKF